VVADIVRLAPAWMIVGVLVGLLAALIVAGLFLAGDRLFDDVGRGPDSRVDPEDRNGTGTGDGAAGSAGAAGGGRRTDGSARRRGEIRTYLDAIGEPFVEDRTVGGVTVAFYLPARDVAITFDARAYFRLREAGTEAVLCEHEMPGSHLGRRLPFETPEVTTTTTTTNATAGPNPGPGPGPAANRGPGAAPASPPGPEVTSAFAELGLSPSADAAEIERAYRARVKQVHPDQGGDRESFRRVREAYAVAQDHREGDSDTDAAG